MSSKNLSRKVKEDVGEEDEELLQQWQEFIVPASCTGKRFDVALTEVSEEIPSRNVSSRLIETSNALLNGRPSKASEKTREGDCIAINLLALENPNLEPEPEKIPLNVLFEDDEVLVINKPAGMVVHPGAGVHTGTLVNAILAHCGKGLPSLGGPVRAGIVHRLDKDTSGVMVVAKTLKALTSLSAQFARHEQTRCYFAVVNGVPSPTAGRIATWHGRDPKHRIKFAVLPEGQGKRAIMDYKCIENYSEFCSLLACTLLTGRTHQIRVQMRHIGCALLGDSLYTAPILLLRSQKELWSRLGPLLTRQMLHAHVLSFQHPINGCQLNFEAPLPQDFIEVLTLLRQAFLPVKDVSEAPRI